MYCVISTTNVGNRVKRVTIYGYSEDKTRARLMVFLYPNSTAVVEMGS